jgi:hypothetical protein
MRSIQRNTAFVSAALAILAFGIFLSPQRHLAAQATPQARIVVIRDEELQRHPFDYEAKEVFRETIRLHYPRWASYTQQLTFGKMVNTYDLATIVWNAGLGCLADCPFPAISVNPSVLLATLILRYGEAPPPGFNAHQTLRQIYLEINRLYQENRDRPQVWQDRFANLGSYVMYQLLGADEQRLGKWLTLYRELVPEARVFQEVTPTSTPTVIVPPPFLERPMPRRLLSARLRCRAIRSTRSSTTAIPFTMRSQQGIGSISSAWTDRSSSRQRYRLTRTNAIPAGLATQVTMA